MKSLNPETVAHNIATAYVKERIRVNETGDGSSTIAGIAGARINDFAGANICAKFLVEPAGEGKVLCPSVR